MSCPTYWKYKCSLLAWEELLSFSVPGGTEKINGLCLLGEGWGGGREISTHSDTMSYWLDPASNYQLRVVMSARVKFTVDNKDKVRMLLTSFWCLYC